VNPTHILVQHDFLDYVAAIGGAAGVAAVIALWFAVFSKRHAGLSAAAAGRSATLAEQTRTLADEQVQIMRQEAAAERGRRAAPTFTSRPLLRPGFFRPVAAAGRLRLS
jgi:hypothetical protein